jgi:hypothetical protein
MANILNALIELVANNTYIVSGRTTTHGGSVMNALGDNLEDYVVDLFAGTLNETDKDKRDNKINSIFSYIGNSTNPPDAMLKGGDAIEVKKIKGDSQLQLNSSYPKHKLYKNDTHICDRCRTCETWEEKDMLYVVGIVPDDKKIKSLFFTYGLTYAAKNEVYDNIVKQMKKGIEEIDGPVFAETKELGRVNQIDLLKRTNLRLRGMYLMENPWNAYGMQAIERDKEIVVYALIPTMKYNSFDNVQMFEDFCDTIGTMTIRDVEVPDPTYPNKTIECKKITFYK